MNLAVELFSEMLGVDMRVRGHSFPGLNNI